MARIWNIFVALCALCSGVTIACNWYVGNPADWFVWFNAIFACAIMFLWCVRDAVRGVW